MAMSVGGCANEDPAGESDFDSAFRESSLPWYDSETNSLTSSSAPDRPDSSVADRGRIPPMMQKVGRTVKREPVLSGAAAPAGSAASTVGNTFMFVVGGILIALLVGLLLYGFFKLESGKQENDGKTGPRRKIRDHIKHLPFEIEEQDGDFETFAEKSLHDGHYNNAVIYLFADLLVAMSESGIVRLQRGKTNRQYLNDIWDYGAIKPYYRKVMIAFEDAFFGKHQIEKARAEDCFAGRDSFAEELEKIRAAKFSAQNQPTAAPAPGLQVNTAG